jgi:endonuclease YncB( thermonuclease family)
MGRGVKYGRSRPRGVNSDPWWHKLACVPKRQRGPTMRTVYIAVVLAGSLGYLAAGTSTIDLRTWLSRVSGQAASGAPPAQQLVGRASIIDGDTITIGAQHVRFNGIDAPESSQSCTDAGGAAYTCGHTAANALDKFLAASRPTRCVFVEWDQHDRFVGNCFRADGESVARWLVRSGYAMDWPRYSNGNYAKEQAAAWEARRGIWAGEVQPPWEWRAAQQVSVTETAVVDEPRVLLSGGCKIKGNISPNTGERIYHMPGQKYYARTKINASKGERMFCSEDEARQAGWRRSRV